MILEAIYPVPWVRYILTAGPLPAQSTRDSRLTTLMHGSMPGTGRWPGKRRPLLMTSGDLNKRNALGNDTTLSWVAVSEPRDSSVPSTRLKYREDGFLNASDAPSRLRAHRSLPWERGLFAGA